MTQRVSFGDLGIYGGGFTLPEGDYAMYFDVQMFAGTKQDGSPAGPARLGVMLTAHPLAGGDPVTQFLSMGSKADQSYAPDPENGKGVVAVAGGAGGVLNNKTNWFLFLKSLYDCGLPAGVFDNDFTTIDGIHVHTQSIPEPEDRKGFGSSRTGDQEENRANKTIPVVTAILDSGKPWEGTGGVPAAKTGPTGVVGKKAPAAAPKAAPKAAAKAPAAPAVELDADDLKAQAQTAAAGVLEKNPGGCAKVVLRTGVFKAIKDEALGNVVLETFFKDDATLNGLIGDLGYTVAGMMVKPNA